MPGLSSIPEGGQGVVDKEANYLKAETKPPSVGLPDPVTFLDSASSPVSDGITVFLSSRFMLRSHFGY